MSIHLDGAINEAYIGRFKLRSIWMGTDCLYQNESGPEPYLPNEYFYFKLSDSDVAYVGFKEQMCSQKSGGNTEITYDKTQFINWVTPSFEYSYNKKEWYPYTLETTITLSKAGHSKVYFRGNNNTPWFDLYETSYSETSSSGSTSTYYHDHYIYLQAIISNGTVRSGGNLLSLRDINFKNINTIPCDYCFGPLFYNCTGLLTPPVLSALTLKKYCYGIDMAPITTSIFSSLIRGMFQGCTNLQYAPLLPATTLAEGCYISMFRECNIIDAPILSAATMEKRCYTAMFYNCRQLINAPILSSTALAYECYEKMFYGCHALEQAPELPATTLEYGCYSGMFANCISLKIAPELPATTLAYECYGGGGLSLTSYCTAGMFQGCINLEEPPALPATTLQSYCYCQMFANCSKLKRIPNLPATTLLEGVYYAMFSNIYSDGGIKANSTSSTPCIYSYRIPTSGTGTTSSDYYKDLELMFAKIDGTSAFAPSINTTFYISVPSF